MDGAESAEDLQAATRDMKEACFDSGSSNSSESSLKNFENWVASEMDFEETGYDED